MQGLLRRILREAYREPTNPPSAGTLLAQSVFAGIPSPSRGPSPCFITHPNYQNGQFHYYHPPVYPSPISQTPTTSAHTTSSTEMNASETSGISTTSITSPISTPSTSSANLLQQFTTAPIQFLQFLEKHTDLILCLLLLLWWNLSPKLTFYW